MSTVSIVGRRLRRLLPRIGASFAVLPAELDVALVSESSEDLNFSLVVSQDKSVPLVKLLHRELIAVQVSDSRHFNAVFTPIHAVSGKRRALRTYMDRA
jgi:hypothetical protein